MAKFKTIPIVVEAFKWTGGPDQIEDPLWIVDAIKSGRITFERSGMPSVYMVIETPQGAMTATPGDYIIRGVDDMIFPCKRDIFIKTYDFIEL